MRSMARIVMFTAMAAAAAFSATPAPPRSRVVMTLAPASPSAVKIFADADAVAEELRSRVDAAAAKAIAARGHFALGVPGGSVLNMLSGTKPDWASKTMIAWVNHKCVPMDDIQLATNAKARAKFLDAGWQGCEVVELTGSADSEAEAKAYDAALRAFPSEVLPVGDDGEQEEDNISTRGPHLSPQASSNEGCSDRGAAAC